MQTEPMIWISQDELDAQRTWADKAQKNFEMRLLWGDKMLTLEEVQKSNPIPMIEPSEYAPVSSKGHYSLDSSNYGEPIGGGLSYYQSGTGLWQQLNGNYNQTYRPLDLAILQNAIGDFMMKPMTSTPLINLPDTSGTIVLDNSDNTYTWTLPTPNNAPYIIEDTNGK